MRKTVFSRRAKINDIKRRRKRGRLEYKRVVCPLDAVVVVFIDPFSEHFENSSLYIEMVNGSLFPAFHVCPAKEMKQRDEAVTPLGISVTNVFGMQNSLSFVIERHWKKKSRETWETHTLMSFKLIISAFLFLLFFLSLWHWIELCIFARFRPKFLMLLFYFILKRAMSVREECSGRVDKDTLKRRHDLHEMKWSSFRVIIIECRCRHSWFPVSVSSQ